MGAWRSWFCGDGRAVGGGEGFVLIQPCAGRVRGFLVPLAAEFLHERAALGFILNARRPDHGRVWLRLGQHRRKAMELVFDFLDTVRSQQKYPKKGGLFVTSDDVVTPEAMALHQRLLTLDTHLDTPALLDGPRGYDLTKRHSVDRDGRPPPARRARPHAGVRGRPG